MTAGGWFFMIASLTGVWAAAIWSFYRLVKAPPEVRDDREGGGPSPPPPSA
ncbi:MAG TPA: hypothetical protein VK698_05195 [Kofleriaceae bacterium]|nr:hypothetical protein [Kofleriaceae bacterium]